MARKVLLVLAGQSDLIKSQIASYTRKDGTFVSQHQDSRSASPAQKPKPSKKSPVELQDIADVHAEVEAGRVTYRGTGSTDAFRIKVKGKEYLISADDFTSLGGHKKMPFAAPARR